MTDTPVIRPTVFIAKKSSHATEAVAAAVGAAGLVAHPVSNLTEITGGESSSNACVVIDLSSLSKQAPEIIQSIQQAEQERPFDLPQPGEDTHLFVLCATCMDDLECGLAEGGITLLKRPYSRQDLLTAISGALERDARLRKLRASARDAERRVLQLTDRERSVARMIYDSLPNKVIASELKMSQRTVENVRARIFEKLGVESAVGLARVISMADSLGGDSSERKPSS